MARLTAVAADCRVKPLRRVVVRECSWIIFSTLRRLGQMAQIIDLEITSSCRIQDIYSPNINTMVLLQCKGNTFLLSPLINLLLYEIREIRILFNYNGKYISDDSIRGQ